MAEVINLASRGILRKRDYAFIDDKHEIIYIMMRLVQLRMAETGKSFTVVIRDAAHDAGMTISAPRGWFTGNTRRPFVDTAFRFCAALGVDPLVPKLRAMAPQGKRAVRSQARVAAEGRHRASA